MTIIVKIIINDTVIPGGPGGPEGPKNVILLSVSR